MSGSLAIDWERPGERERSLSGLYIIYVLATRNSLIDDRLEFDGVVWSTLSGFDCHVNQKELGDERQCIEM
ncbi:hypothetical protein BgiBS90_021444 [Biomphalaria glabrata]|nr:hypothetical protein BgiBS90_021444 [Biomphalaria glabrata]